MSTTYINVKSKIFAQNFNFKLEIELHLWFSMQLGQYIHYCHCPRVGRPEHLHLHPYHSDIIASRSHCREWALLSFHSVCLSVCRSFRDLQPTTIDWSQPMNQIWLAGIYLYSDPCKPFPILWVPEGKICKISPISNAYSCHCERDASCHMTCSTNTYINKEIIDSRLCPWCRILMNSTKHSSCLTSNGNGHLANSSKHNAVLDSGPLAPWYENMMSSTKPEVDNILQRCQRRTEPRPQTTCTENWVKLGGVVFEFASKQTDTETNKQTDILITITYSI